jgi:ABC-type antimicrobial peptide transport system permease subunit
VQAVSLADIPAFGSGYAPLTLKRGGLSYRAFVTRTQADYFSALGLRLVRGRTYTAQEVAAAAPVAVISESAAREFWPDVDPIGQSFERFDRSRAIIIGIVSDAIAVRLQELRAAAVYWPLTLPQTARIVVRTSGPPEALVPVFRTVLQPLDPQVQLDVTLVRDGLEKELDQPRLVASMSFALATLALGLALVGIYGVTSFVAGQRTHEIGVRMAVGATKRDVMRLLLTDSLRPVSIGLGAGLILALLASRVLTGMLYGIKAHDPVTFAGAFGVLVVSAIVAVYVPTRRASRVDPLFVLRQS